MGFGFKIGGNGIILKDPKLELSVGSLSISGAELTKTFSIDWKGDGEPVVASSNTGVATVSLNGNIVTATFVSQGNATITVTVPRTKHYFKDEAEITVTCTRSNASITLSKSSVTATGAGKTASFTINSSTSDGTISVVSSNTGVATVSKSNMNVTVTYVTAGSSTITVSTPQTARYNATSATCAVTCSKSAPSYTAPTAKSLTYTRSNASTIQAQALLNAGSVTSGQGTMQYSSNNSTWSTTVPTGTTAQTYTVYYRVVGNTYYSDVASKSIKVTIAKRTLTKPSLSGTTSFTNTTGTTRSVSSNSYYNSVYMTTGGTWSASAIGTYTVSWSLRDTANTVWSGNTTAAHTQNWSITYSVYNRGASKDSPGNGGTITFTGHKGEGSGDYCYYFGPEGSGGILMESKGSSATYKKVLFSLNSAIPAGKTVHIDWYCNYQWQPAESAKTVDNVYFNINGTWTRIGYWTWPQSQTDITTSGSVSEIRIEHGTGFGNTHIYRIWVT